MPISKTKIEQIVLEEMSRIKKLNEENESPPSLSEMIEWVKDLLGEFYGAEVADMGPAIEELAGDMEKIYAVLLEVQRDNNDPRLAAILGSHPEEEPDPRMGSGVADAIQQDPELDDDISSYRRGI